MFENINIVIKIYIDEIIQLTDKNEIKGILKEFYNSLLGGHVGIKRTIKKIKEIYFWGEMKKDIKNYTATCLECQKNKIIRKTRMPMVIKTTSKKPFDKIAIDIVGPLPITTNGYKYILTCQDDLSRYLLGIPLINEDSDSVARALTEHVILKYDCPFLILSDRGSLQIYLNEFVNY